MNNISMKLNADNLIMLALQEDITSEDITTNSVMREYQLGEVELICKEDGVIAGLDVFKRVFELLDNKTEVTFTCTDGDEVKKPHEPVAHTLSGIHKALLQKLVIDALQHAFFGVVRIHLYLIASTVGACRCQQKTTLLSKGIELLGIRVSVYRT